MSISDSVKFDRATAALACVAVLAGCAAAPRSPVSPTTSPARSPVMQTFVSRDGTAIACFKSGSGPPLVLVHGTTADHHRWAPILPALEARYTVYAIDRRGRGASGDATDYAIEREFEDVAAVVDGIGGPVSLLGHSYGAICSAEATLLAHHVRKLILYEPPLPTGMPIYPPGVIERLQTRLDAGDRSGVVETFMLEVPRVPPAQLERMKGLPAWQARVGAAHTIVRELRAHQGYEFVGEKFRSLETPTLLLLGGSSPAFFGAAIEAAHAAIPGSRVVVLPGQQHVAIDTAPDLFAREVLAFLADGPQAQ
jgi:pimeloyl-ACP methyl ester carboxylesterase